MMFFCFPATAAPCKKHVFFESLHTVGFLSFLPCIVFYHLHEKGHIEVSGSMLPAFLMAVPSQALLSLITKVVSSGWCN